MRSAFARVCPRCGTSANGLTCAVDGWATVPFESAVQGLAVGLTVLERFTITAHLDEDGAVASHAGVDAAGQPVRIAAIALASSAALSEVERMRSAAATLPRVDHPGIAKALASGIERGVLIIVSQQVEGESLEALLKQGPFDNERAIELGLGLFGALEAAHQHGVAHHDLAPARVRLTATGQVVMTDLGYADILRSPEALFDESPTLSRGALYRAPEQGRARTVTRHADIWSVGAILYEALTGTPIAESAADLSALAAPHIERPLAEMVARCLEKKPWNRYDTAAIARAALEAARDAIEQAGPIGRARLGEIGWDTPRAEPATRESSRPAIEGSGLLDLGWKSEPSAQLAAPDVELGAPIARPMVQHARRRGSPWWILAAAAVLVAGGIGVALWQAPVSPTAAEPRAQEWNEPIRSEAKRAAQVQEVSEARAKRDAEARVKLEAEARAKRDAEARAKLEAEARAKRDAEARAAEVKLAAEAQRVLEAARAAEAKIAAEAKLATAEPEPGHPILPAKKKTWSQLRAEEAALERAEAQRHREAMAKAKIARELREAETARVAAEQWAARNAAWKVKLEELKRQREAQLLELKRAAAAKRVRPGRLPPEAVPTAPISGALVPNLNRTVLVTVPAAARVLRDGQPIGLTPLTLSWPTGVTTRVQVMLDGHLPAAIDLGDAQNNKMVQLELAPAPQP